MDPATGVGMSLGALNSLIGFFKGIKQAQEGKKLQAKLDAQGRPILETPDAFNEVEGLVRSNYLDPRLLGETRIKDEIKAREANQIQNIQQTAGSGADALLAYNTANMNTDKSLFDVDMKAYEQQINDYNNLLGTLGQKANYEEKQFDYNILQPFKESSEQAKALIQAGNQNQDKKLNDLASYGMMGGQMMGGQMMGGGKQSGNGVNSNSTTTDNGQFKNISNNMTMDQNQSGANTQANVDAANGVTGNQNGNNQQIDAKQLQGIMEFLANYKKTGK